MNEEIVNFETLLDDAHSKGLKGISTQLLAIDLEKRYALFKAVATGEKGSYEGHGEVTVENVGNFVKIHWLRMAETRAIVRALKLYTNNTTCAQEEK